MECAIMFLTEVMDSRVGSAHSFYWPGRISNILPGLCSRYANNKQK